MTSEKLTPHELRQVRRLLSVYGAIKTFCKNTCIHRTTVARMLKTGEASPLVTDKVREFIPNPLTTKQTKE